MFKKIFIFSLSLVFIPSAWADTTEKMKQQYDSFSNEAKQKAKDVFSNIGWEKITESTEHKIYMNYNYVKPDSYGQSEAWIKIVVYNDITKDGLGVGDYIMVLNKYNCSDSTSKNLSYTEYNKTGNVISSATSPSYQSYKQIIPETVGESQLKWACFFSYVKSN